jgi:hypothetical protein
MDGLAVNGHQSPPARRVGLAALIVVIIGVLALAAAAFVLSYSGVRGTALNAGVTPGLARVYPLIFDGVLVVACAAAISLQGARWWLRLYAWLAVLVIVGAVAAADSVHAMAVRLPKHPIEAAGAIVPWVVLLIGFTLLYAMARQAWPHRKAAPAVADGPASVTAEPPAAGPAVTEPAAEPPESQPPEPQPPEPQPPEPQPPEPQPPEPQPSESQPPESQPPESLPPESQPPAPAPPGPESSAELSQTAGDTRAAEPARTGQPAPEAEPAAAAEYRARTSRVTLSELLDQRSESAPGPSAVVDPLPVRHAPERDEPSDADAEPAPQFNRLRSSPTPPENHPWIMDTGVDDE